MDQKRVPFRPCQRTSARPQRAGRRCEEETAADPLVLLLLLFQNTKRNNTVSTSLLLLLLIVAENRPGVKGKPARYPAENSPDIRRVPQNHSSSCLLRKAAAAWASLVWTSVAGAAWPLFSRRTLPVTSPSEMMGQHTRADLSTPSTGCRGRSSEA